MKKLILGGVLCLSSMNALQAQSLVNTTWAYHYPGDDLFQYFHFGADTLSWSSDNTTFTAYSEVWYAGDTVTFVDLQQLPGGCLFSDTGSYTYEVENDTVRFSPINDPCIVRYETLDEGYGVSVFVGLGEMSPHPLVTVFPNPSPNGTFRLLIPADVAVYNSLELVGLDGRVIVQRALPINTLVDEYLQLEAPAAGVYLLTLTGTDLRTTISLVVEAQ